MKTKKMTNFQRLMIIEDIASQYGLLSQLDMMVEECGELIVAINHYKRQRVKEDEVIEEIADVWIVLVQLALLLGQKDVIEMVDKKLRRVERVINELKNN